MKNLEKSVQEHQEKVIEMKTKYQEISKDFEELEGAKLIVDEELVQFEEKTQQLEKINEQLKAAKLAVDEKLVQVEEKNQELLRKFEAQEKTLLVNKSVDSY